MKNFLQIYGIILVISFVFVCFGARIFLGNIYLTAAAFDMIIAGIAAVLVKQSDRIDKLEDRIKKLEQEEGSILKTGD